MSVNSGCKASVDFSQMNADSNTMELRDAFKVIIESTGLTVGIVTVIEM